METRSVGGFALVLAVFAIVVIGAVVTGGYFLSTRQFRVGKARLRTNSALYAAEAGLSAGLAGWDVPFAEGLAPGQTEPLLSGQLSTGDGYGVWLTRLDADTVDPVAYYLLRSMGRARGAYGGRREVDLLLRSQAPQGICCGAALQTRGHLTIAASAAVSGRDTVPPAWAERCSTGDGLDRPGVGIDGTLQVEGTVSGDPPARQVSLTADDFFLYGDLTYDGLADAADLEYSGASTQLNEIAAAVGFDGKCDRATISNWGAPEDAGPCSLYFPVIHASGDLRIGSGQGQGVLLVDGDLIVGGDWTFYGPVIVRGKVDVSGGAARIYGGLRVYDGEGDAWTLGGASRVAYSGCAVARAVRYSELNRAQPLARRPWMELFN